MQSRGRHTLDAHASERAGIWGRESDTSHTAELVRSHSRSFCRAGSRGHRRDLDKPTSCGAPQRAVPVTTPHARPLGQWSPSLLEDALKDPSLLRPASLFSSSLPVPIPRPFPFSIVRY